MLDTLKKYDIFLVDAYGVFWDGANFIDGTKELLKLLVEEGKTVIILSNATARSESAINKYKKLGLLQGEHYHAFVTSGEVARKKLEHGLIINDQPLEKYYTIGTHNHGLFEGLDYKPSVLDQADFVYIGIPQFTKEEKELLENNYPLYESCLTHKDQKPRWDTTEIAGFSSMLEEVKKTSLPVFNANPDLRAPEKCNKTKTTNYVVRQGMIANWLEEQKMDVHHFGKPYTDVYSFCHDLIAKENIGPSVDIKTAKVVMIGDTVETDILGAHNATQVLNWPVESILTLTGNAGRLIDDMDDATAAQYLEAQFQKFQCVPTHIMTSFSTKGNVFSL